MNLENNILSDITVHSKYARFLPDKGRRETWNEIVDRNVEMHVTKYPHLEDRIKEVYARSVYNKNILPSMRSLQFAGPPIERNNSRIYNCFSGEIEFMTNKGLRTFHNTVNSKQRVLAGDGQWREADIKSFGKQRLQTVSFKHPYRTNLRMVYNVTENHRWVLLNGDVTTSLKVGDKVKYQSDSEVFNEFEFDEGFMHGLIFADGTEAKENRYMIRLCGDKADKLNVIKNHKGFRTVCYPPSYQGDPVATVVTFNKLKQLPVKSTSNSYLRGFIKGWLEFDGSKKKDQKAYCLDTTDSQAADWLIKNAPYAGLFATGINITNSPTNCGERNKPLNRISLAPVMKYWLVESIEKTLDEREVYCAVEPVTQSFTLSGGVMTGNCAYLPVEHIDAFSETMFLLLGGTGVGYSVQERHVSKLPIVFGPKQSQRRFIIADSIEGWADAVKMLVESYFTNRMSVRFDFSDIREKGAELITSGGRAPGPEPLRECLDNVRKVLNGAVGRKLTSLEVHDIQCLLADAVLAGGIRRAAMISLFSMDDDEMLNCKSGDWWADNPQRSRANNSVALLRGEVTEEQFAHLWERVKLSGAGEPGFYWTNDLDWGTNPCCEIALEPYQFCNLTEINASTVDGQDDFKQRAMDASFIGTLQAGYTDFHYLRDIWKRTTERAALIGVGITGIASGNLDTLNLEEAADSVNRMNVLTSAQINISQAHRTTTVKPSGTSSLVVGSSSGIHAYHNDFYIRRMRFGKDEEIYQYLLKKIPALCEDEFLKPELQGVVSIPQRAPIGAATRKESVFSLLERVMRFNDGWVGTGTIANSINSNNVSCTISVKDGEWDGVRDWMWQNQIGYNGISILPYDGGTYVQAPFEDIDEATYDEMVKDVKAINLSRIKEEEDNTNLAMEAACSGGLCEIP